MVLNYAFKSQLSQHLNIRTTDFQFWRALYIVWPNSVPLISEFGSNYIITKNKSYFRWHQHFYTVLHIAPLSEASSPSPTNRCTCSGNHGRIYSNWYWHQTGRNPDYSEQKKYPLMGRAWGRLPPRRPPPHSRCFIEYKYPSNECV